MDTKHSGIFRILISVLLILTMILPGILNTISIAEGEVSSSESFAGSSVVSMGGKAYLTSKSDFRLNYQIKNEGSSNIVQVKVQERLDGEDGVVISEPEITIWESVIESGDNKSFNGREFKTKQGVSTYILDYTIEYKEEGNEQWIVLKSNKKQISTISTGINVQYKTNAGGKVPAGQEVEYTAELQSNASVNIENITVADSALGELGVIPNLAPGETKSISKTFKLNETTKSHLVLKYDDPTGISEKVVKTIKDASVEVLVEKEQVEEPLILSGKVNKTSIAPNEEVDFSLNLVNKGNRNLNNVKLVDWTGKEIFSKETLSPGKEGIVIYTEKVKPGQHYEFKASAVEEETGRDIQATYGIKLTGIDAELQIINKVTPHEVALGDTVNIEYILKNTGKVTMVDISINEPDFGEVGDFSILEPGQQEVFSIEKIIDGDTKSYPKVYAKDKSSGYDYEFQGDLVEIGINVEDSFPLLTIRLTSEPESLTEAGTVSILCTVINEGDMKIDNIELTLNERELNIGSILGLEPGGEETLTLPGISIEENTTFTVTARGFTYDDQEVQFVSDPYEVQIGEDILEEEVENPKLKFLKNVLWVIGGLILATVAGMVYLILDLRRGGKKKARFRKKKTSPKK
ncbi:MAG TPA: hypothetical protein VFD57_08170 [Clostridia bacterium]|nr:hypothetical protein [Clostridia bacterium]